MLLALTIIAALSGGYFMYYLANLVGLSIGILGVINVA